MKMFRICTVGQMPGQIRELRLADRTSNGDDYGEGEPYRFPAHWPTPPPPPPAEKAEPKPKQGAK